MRLQNIFSLLTRIFQGVYSQCVDGASFIACIYRATFPLILFLAVPLIAFECAKGEKNDLKFLRDGDPISTLIRHPVSSDQEGPKIQFDGFLWVSAFWR